MSEAEQARRCKKAPPFEMLSECTRDGLMHHLPEMSATMSRANWMSGEVDEKFHVRRLPLE